MVAKAHDVAANVKLKLTLSLDSTHAKQQTPPPTDGDLDLYVTNSYTANKLFRNDGDGTFSDVSSSAGVAYNEGISIGVAWGDYDGTVCVKSGKPMP